MRITESVLQFLDQALVWYKRYLSPLLPQSCRFEPTCSEYAREALRKYGLWKGLLLSLWRMLRCNPYSRGGYDPVK
ncbi:MAG: membrane protein insertion efficiency factor YidD [Candidatus Caldatribacterium sp.]|nr:membrane protein insertion efficiency factor YidD [Candidatus Caldatribacterium sp.]MCX7730372.1 membrane protein insertion efficiency factor YidD [Candidatus Caldatribacterium sp.]